MRYLTLTIFILAVSAISPTRTASGSDLVIDWNNVLLDTVRSGSLPPPPATRAMAIMNTAIFDAVNSIAGTHQPYHYSPISPPELNASKEAAVAQAAYQVLSTMFPTNLEVYNSALTTSLADIADGANKEAGITLGTEAAMAILSLRSSDGARMPVSYMPGTDPGDWQPTPPAFAAAAVPHWANVRPWTMDNVSQFRQGGPPELSSDEYAAAFDEVKEIGAVDSTTRTEDQSNIAKFWAGPTGTSTPAGQWNRIAQAASEQQGLDVRGKRAPFCFCRHVTGGRRDFVLGQQVSLRFLASRYGNSGGRHGRQSGNGARLRLAAPADHAQLPDVHRCPWNRERGYQQNTGALLWHR